MSYVIASKTFITRQSLMMLLFAVLHQCALKQPSRRKASYRLASDGHIFDAEPEVMEEQVKIVWNLEETLKWKCFHLYIILLATCLDSRSLGTFNRMLITLQQDGLMSRSVFRFH